MAKHDPSLAPADGAELGRYVRLKLSALGEPVWERGSDAAFLDLARPLLRNHCQKDELLGWPLAPIDRRIQDYLDSILADVGPVPAIPGRTLVLDRPGLSRLLSLPENSDTFASPYLTSYRLAQGVLHNPKSDRRTTQGVFHVAEGGLPVPEDKLAVPKATFARLLAAALEPPADVMTIPFTAEQPEPARLFVSLVMRPLVCPATASEPNKTMEVRFFAPGTLVSNLDFVESIFGNAGDPFLPENDAALDVMGWSGHTGCVILAPHLVGLRKKDVGLPHYDGASERQRRDGMCYRDDGELYNGGQAFKITCRDQRGVIVTVIADNYYGYCKKEVKTQISFAANLYGLCEEEHAGGAVAYPSQVLGSHFNAASAAGSKGATFESAMKLVADRVEVKDQRYAVDRCYPDVYYVPENAEFSVRDGLVRWPFQGASQTLVLRASDVYVLPSGYKVRLERQFGGENFRLVGSRAEGVLCHKPCTVSGGGKSEISKSLTPMIRPAPVFVKNFEHDFDVVEGIVKRDFSSVYRGGPPSGGSRPLLGRERSLGSVIKLFTPSEDYTDEHNEWLRRLPQTIRQLLFVLKRYYQPEWGDAWRSHFSVDRVNGFPGHELKFDDEKLVSGYLRVGFEPETGAWRMYKLRPDFRPADKVQVEDDITASRVVPRREALDLPAEYPNASVKIVSNCEEQLFQRPDDAIHRGFDLQAEADIASPDTFITNFEPLDRAAVTALVDHVTEFDRFSEPMQRRLLDFCRAASPGFVVSSAHPRLVGKKPSKNPRYLQRRPDCMRPRDTHVAEMGSRLHGQIPSERPLLATVHAVLAGRRASPGQTEVGLPPLAVYSPIHYQELPELFMDFLSSLTGKSPSTTGFGSEGALTKGPFNALLPVVDMNNALLSAILTGYAGFTSVAGYVGPSFKVDHDISMLIPEIWCRTSVAERDPRFLIERGYLEPVQDFELNGRRVLASRLGYRITSRFVDHFLGRLFEAPDGVFTEDMLRPERQSLESFAAGVDAIVETQTRVASSYFADGSVEAACPPLKALLHLMVRGSYDGMTRSDPRFIELFSREATLASDWYRARLQTKQARDIELWKRHLAALEQHHVTRAGAGIDIAARKHQAQSELDRVSSPAYLEALVGTLGADPFHRQIPRDVA